MLPTHFKLYPRHSASKKMKTRAPASSLSFGDTLRDNSARAHDRLLAEYTRDVHKYFADKRANIARRTRIVAATGRTHATLFRETDWFNRTPYRAMFGYRCLNSEETFAVFKDEFERVFPGVRCERCSERRRLDQVERNRAQASLAAKDTLFRETRCICALWD